MPQMGAGKWLPKINQIQNSYWVKKISLCILSDVKAANDVCYLSAAEVSLYINTSFEELRTHHKWDFTKLTLPKHTETTFFFSITRFMYMQCSNPEK